MYTLEIAMPSWLTKFIYLAYEVHRSLIPMKRIPHIIILSNFSCVVPNEKNGLIPKLDIAITTYDDYL